jgi:EpsI family protein
MIARALVVVAVLFGAAAVSSRVTTATEVKVDRQPLATLPADIGEWRGRAAAPLADDVLAQLGVDDYINRTYFRAGAAPIGLYVGYYDSQRQGDTIHSPQNCLPGAGWRPVSSSIEQIRSGGRSMPVNRYVIQKGIDQQVVYYWYQGRGRVVANEYVNKALLMFDAARLHRTNGGLVRVITPVAGTVDEATRQLTGFVTALFPLLDGHLP